MKEFNHATQEDSRYGCGMVSVANALMLDNYINPIRDADSRKGNRLGQLNKWLIEDYRPYYLDALYVDYYGGYLPEQAFKFKAFNEGQTMPVMYSVVPEHGDPTHWVAGHINSDNVLTLMDPMKTNIIQITPNIINELYDRVVGVYTFFNLYEGHSLEIDEPEYENVKEGFEPPKKEVEVKGPRNYGLDTLP